MNDPSSNDILETTDSDIMTADEVAILLRVNRKSIYKSAAQNQIPCIKIGHVYRFSRQAVLKWLTGQGRVSQKRK